MARTEGFFFEIANAGVIRLLQRDLWRTAKQLAGHTFLRRAFERMRDEVMIPSIDQNFARQGRPKKWPPIDPDTIAWRIYKSGRRGVSREAILRAYADRSFENSILIFTGKGRKSATAKARFHIKENVMTYGDWPETTWYMQVHDVPEFAASAGIPHRPFALIQPEDQVACGEILLEWVESRINANIRMHYV